MPGKKYFSVIQYVPGFIPNKLSTLVNHGRWGVGGVGVVPGRAVALKTEPNYKADFPRW